MSDELSEEEADAELAQALAGGTPQHVGWFRFYFADERWEWSPQVAQMHGYEPGEITPTTEIILSHKHPDDYRQVAATLEEIRRTAQAFSTRHRIIDVQQHVHHVVCGPLFFSVMCVLLLRCFPRLADDRQGELRFEWGTPSG